MDVVDDHVDCVRTLFCVVLQLHILYRYGFISMRDGEMIPVPWTDGGSVKCVGKEAKIHCFFETRCASTHTYMRSIHGYRAQTSH